MTSLGRLIFFDQPGTGASDPVSPGALPTLEQWADSITAVLDDLRESVKRSSSRSTARSRQRRFCSNTSFARGAHKLKGVPGDWHLFAVTSTQLGPVPVVLVGKLLNLRRRLAQIAGIERRLGVVLDHQLARLGCVASDE